MKSERILITGASSGIGEAATHCLLEAGHRVCAISRGIEPLANLQKRFGTDQLLVHSSDVTKAEEMQSIVQEVSAQWGGIDVCIPNAGLGVFAPLEEGQLADWHRMFDVNIGGVLNTIHACLPHLLKEHGLIINIGSIAARNVFPNSGIYCATKHAILAVSESLRIEFRDRLAITTINPGAVNTSFIDQTHDTDLRETYRPQFEAGMEPSFIADAILMAISSKGRGVFSEITVRPDRR